MVKLKIVSDTVSVLTPSSYHYLTEVSIEDREKLIEIVEQFNKHQKEFLLTKLENFISEISDAQFSPEEISKFKNKAEAKKAKKIIKKYGLRKASDGKTYLKDFDILVPDIMLPHIENSDNDSYENFLKLLSTNPIQAIREKLPTYVIENNLRITPNGYIIGARQVWLVTGNGDQVVDNLKSTLFKVVGEGKLPQETLVDITTGLPPVNKTFGNDDVVYLDHAIESKVNAEGAVYTDDYTKTFRWKVGEVMDLGKKTRDNTEKSCGSDMLHIRSNPKDLNGYGDTNILVIINPADVVSCVTAWKFGVSKCFFAALLEKGEEDIFNVPLQTFETDYMGLEWEAIQEQLPKASDLGTFNLSGEPMANNKAIEEILKERMVMFNAPSGQVEEEEEDPYEEEEEENDGWWDPDLDDDWE